MQHKNTMAVAFLTFILILSYGCISNTAPYHNMDNWAIRQNAVPRYFANYDVIFVYPSMFDDPSMPILNWIIPPHAENIFNYSKSQTQDIFGIKVRVFTPFVHQLAHSHYQKLVEEGRLYESDNGLAVGILDTKNAIQHYLDNYHKPGHPYIIFGQGQGAVQLYEAMKECKDISPLDGFVAAYLLGIPSKSQEDILDDFGSRGITPAQGADDTGVICIWNTQGTIDDYSPYVTPGTYVINPVNWRTDETPASIEHHLGTICYDFQAKKITERTLTLPPLCDAVIDSQKGVLRIDSISVMSQCPALHLDENACYTNIHSLFLRNIAENATERVQQFKYQYDWRLKNSRYGKLLNFWEKKEEDEKIFDIIQQDPAHLPNGK